MGGRQMSQGRRHAWPLIAWVATLIAALWVFQALGRGAMAGPSLTQPATWGQWAASREPVEAVFAVLRMGVIAIAWYLLGVTTVGAVTRLLRSTRLVAVADLLTVPLVRRILQGALGLGLATAAVASAHPASAPPRDPPLFAVAADPVRQPPEGPHATMRRLAPAGYGRRDRDGAGHTSAGDPAEDVAPLRGLPVDDPAGLPGTGVGHPSRAADAKPGASAPADEQPGSWEVRDGDHLWGIADHVLTTAWDRTPTDAEVGEYWHRLVERNRKHLADPGNPDLIYPGQVFDLPPPSR